MRAAAPPDIEKAAPKTGALRPGLGPAATQLTRYSIDPRETRFSGALIAGVILP
jgi:hypothetical protein